MRTPLRLMSRRWPGLFSLLLLLEGCGEFTAPSPDGGPGTADTLSTEAGTDASSSRDSAAADSGTPAGDARTDLSADTPNGGTDGPGAADAPSGSPEVNDTSMETGGKLDGPAMDAPSQDKAPPPDAAPDAPSQPPACGKGGQCEQISMEYSAAIERAKACYTAATNQCQHKAQASLPCGCTIWVNSTVATAPLVKRWNDAGCDQCVYACPLIRCLPLTSGKCAANNPTVSPAIIADPPAVLPPDGVCQNSGIITPV